MNSQNSKSTVLESAIIDRVLAVKTWKPYIAPSGHGAWGYEAVTPEGRVAVEVVIEHLVGFNGEAGIGADGVCIEIATTSGPKRYLIPGAEGTKIWREVESAASKVVQSKRPVRELD